ncbi:hypothetical protein [Bordetella petrii]|uniref:Uncharacterized protein n=1 Tax=Bordetella petrii (strain ATCC BAA-461 / DSM 12804 / CCUG 43448 / CIP 107267 / Se-1111R) TaxID=340100 RepID=A9IHW7_BORPD|nr:hypothetical protein [Bordetella petrii]CAP42001.1 hypothetical protein predicted by Glimmer/Critica [Bordetella petrii]
MAVVYVEFERERARKARSANQARHARTAPARAGDSRRTFLACLILAPLAGLAAPLLAVPWLGQPAGWLLAGAGLLACVLLLFRLAMLEADRSRDRD